MPVLTASDCEYRLRKTRLGPAYKLHEGMVCAGGEQGKDACKVKFHLLSLLFFDKTCNVDWK